MPAGVKPCGSTELAASTGGATWKATAPAVGFQPGLSHQRRSVFQACVLPPQLMVSVACE